MHAVLSPQPISCMPPQAHSQASPAQQPQQHDAQFEFLQAAFVEYAGALRETCGESNRSRLLNLTAQLQAKGVHGSHALQLIQQYSAQINWQGMTPDVFNSFYRFVYFICREPNKRNVQVSTAVAAWRMVLRGRFRLLDRWCTYVAVHHKASVVLEDTWRQVLDFSRTVHEDLSNYDPASAWPVLLDEFVEHLKGGRRPGRPSPLAVEAADLLAPWAGRGMTARSPRSGSKRRPPDVMEVADQLQQLPLLSTCEQPAPAGGAAAAADGDGSSGSTPQRQLLPKRLRMGMLAPPPPPQQQQQQQHKAGASPAGDAVMHSRRLAGGVNLFAAAFGTLDGSMQVPYHQQQQQQQAESGAGGLGLTPGAYTAVLGGSSSRVVAAGGAAGPAYALPAGLVLREAGQGLQQQQQQQHGLAMQQQQQHEQQHQMDVSLFPDACGSQDMMDVAPEQHAGQCLGLDQQQQQHLQRSSTPPAVPPAAGHLAAGHLLSQDAENMRRISPLMQVTVTEALGLH